MNLKSFPPEILRKCNPSAIKRLSRFLSFSRAQFQAFALDADRRRNNSSPVLQSTSAGDLVINIFASQIDVLSEYRPHD